MRLLAAVLALLVACADAGHFNANVAGRLNKMRRREVQPDELQSRTLVSAALSPDGSSVLLSFKDGPSVLVAAAESISPFAAALATAESEPARSLDDPAALISSFLKRGYKTVSSCGFGEARRALRMDLEDSNGDKRSTTLFCAECLDDTSVNSFDRIGLTVSD